MATPGQKGFVGGNIDPTTNLTPIGAREYDPSIGQFISIDPILSLDQHQSLNGYSYAENTPVTASDPAGLTAQANHRGGRAAHTSSHASAAICGSLRGVADGLLGPCALGGSERPRRPGTVPTVAVWLVWPRLPTYVRRGKGGTNGMQVQSGAWGGPRQYRVACAGGRRTFGWSAPCCRRR
ncbi:RHS repeat-associated core domain-containing protein [Streptomyces sp. NBC_01022]|uniref:RHS repeat-associated core domain-containing protein n=1 Tax=Streptomyces sp. NBC_01022 TaxID=2903723 RepID=UPI003FA3454A